MIFLIQKEIEMYGSTGVEEPKSFERLNKIKADERYRAHVAKERDRYFVTAGVLFIIALIASAIPFVGSYIALGLLAISAGYVAIAIGLSIQEFLYHPDCSLTWLQESLNKGGGTPKDSVKPAPNLPLTCTQNSSSTTAQVMKAFHNAPPTQPWKTNQDVASIGQNSTESWSISELSTEEKIRVAIKGNSSAFKAARVARFQATNKEPGKSIEETKNQAFLNAGRRVLFREIQGQEELYKVFREVLNDKKTAEQKNLALLAALQEKEGGSCNNKFKP